MDKAQIREHLKRANQHVNKGEQLIEQQEERLEEMTKDGHPSKLHKETLETFRKVEQTMKKDRDAVRKELDENLRRTAIEKRHRNGRSPTCLSPLHSSREVIATLP